MGDPIKLCLRCGEKYRQDHFCIKKQYQVMLMEEFTEEEDVNGDRFMDADQ